MRRLIINADDFGYTRGVNRAIMEAHRAGLVTSATLMAEGAEFEDAVRLAQAATGLSVGCHVVLIGGKPLLPAQRVPSLLGHPAQQACFRNGWGAFAAAAICGRLVAKEVEAEATAQIRKLQQAGIRVTHVDTHKHAHIFPSVLQPLLRAAKACGVPAVRDPFEPVRLGMLLRRTRLWQRGLGVGMLNGFAGSFRRAVREAGMYSPEGSLGMVATGHWDPSLFRDLMGHIPEGTWELVCHPGYDDAQLRALPTRLRESREQELQILTSPETRSLLANHGVLLASYHDLPTN